MNNWTLKDIKDKKLVSNAEGTTFENISNRTVKKVAKIEPGAAKVEAKIFIKHLSNNKAWKGRRFKTKEHEDYCSAVTLLLPNYIIVPDGLLKVEYEFGVSSNGSDWDNGIKSFQDLLSAKYGFNDNRIMQALVRKIIVKKGQEYISFKIEKH